MNSRFTVLDLLDLALRVPEVGAVNFNLLHSALTLLVVELGLSEFRPEFPLDEIDQMTATLALKKARVADDHLRWRAKIVPKPPRVKVEKVVEEKTIFTKEIVEREKEVVRERVVIKEQVVGKEKSTGKKVEDRPVASVPPMVTSQEEVREETSADGRDYPEQTEAPNVRPSAEQQQASPSIEGEQVSSSETEAHPSAEAVTEMMEVEKVEGMEEGVEVMEEGVELMEEGVEGMEEGVEGMEEGAEVQGEPQVEEIEEEEELAPQVEESELQSKARMILEGPTTVAGRLMAKELLKEPGDEGTEPISTNLLQEMWRTVNVNRRIEGMEEGIEQISNLVDDMWEKVQDLGDNEQATLSLQEAMEGYLKRIKILEQLCLDLKDQLQAANEYTRSEVARLEAMIKDFELGMETQRKEMDDLKKMMENFATKDDLEEKTNEIMEALNAKIKQLKSRMRELQDMIIPKEEFMELLSRVDTLEVDKVSREELGRLLEPGFIDNFLAEQKNLRDALESLMDEVRDLESGLESLIRRIDEEIMKYIEEHLAELQNSMDSMMSKLDTLDADDINDTFARLEELSQSIMKDMNNIKAAQSKMERDLKANLKKIADLSSLLDKLDALKADKKKMYELLEMKADLEMLEAKLDKTEFVEIITEVQDNHDRLATQVKKNEQEMSEGFLSIRHELSFKMYTEDFVVGTEPMRNRIKAMLYEQKKIKELIATNLFPDAPGVTKCFSCKRSATLKGGVFLSSGDNGSSLPKHVTNISKESPKESPKRPLSSPPLPPPEPLNSTEQVLESVLKSVQEMVDGTKSVSELPNTDPKSSEKISSQLKLPPIDLDSVPLPPEGKPRITDIHQLPLLLASAKPQVGLPYQKSRKEIDKEVEGLLSNAKFPTVRGDYTKTNPQQRGLSFQTIEFPVGKKSEVLLEGEDKKCYRGASYTVEAGSNDKSRSETKRSDPSKERSKKAVRLSVAVLKGGSQKSQPTPTVPVPTDQPKDVKSKLIRN